MSEGYRQVALDTETTGLYPHKGARMIELGLVELINYKLTGKTYLQRFRPPEGTEMSDGAFDVHGISLADLAKEPTFEEKAQEILDWIGEADIIGHRISFDLGFLDWHYNQMDISKWTYEEKFSFEKKVRADPKRRADKDTGKMSNVMFGKYHKLDTLCDKLGIDRSGRGKHNALRDAELCALCYISMIGKDSDAFIERVEKPQEIIRINRDEVGPLPVIKATDEEVEKHLAFYGCMEEIQASFKGKKKMS